MKILNRVNLFWLLFLPYISKTIYIIIFEVFVEVDIKNSLFFVMINVLLIYMGIRIKHLNKSIKIIIYAATVICLYYKLMIQEYLILFNSITITLIILIAATSLVLKLLWERFKFWRLYFIVFLLLYSSLILVTDYVKFIIPKDDNIYLNKKYNKIFFIILDEYSSPLDLYKNYSDTSIFNFSKYLKKGNWIVYENINSDNTQTLKSISSIFNFGLKTIDNDNNIYSIHFLKNSKFINILENEKYYILNQSFLQIGKYKETHEVFFKYPRNIFEILIYNTIFFEYFRNKKITPEKYNIEIIKNMNEMKVMENNFFVYFHLLMPHTPFFFKNEINVIKENDYLKYWKFTNHKLKYTLSKLQKNNPNAKIIIMGDHGYRGNKYINSKKTFIATYGFEKLFEEKVSQEIFKIFLEDSIKN